MNEFEYAISEGDGTLIDFGRCDYMDIGALVDNLAEGQSITAAKAGEECETGL